jgi:hypothetical protein
VTARSARPFPDGGNGDAKTAVVESIMARAEAEDEAR